MNVYQGILIMFTAYITARLILSNLRYRREIEQLNYILEGYYCKEINEAVREGLNVSSRSEYLARKRRIEAIEKEKF